jgi:adenylate kinase family enzyme
MAKRNQKINSVSERSLLIIDETPLKIDNANITKKLLSNIKKHEEKIKKFSTQDVELYEAWFRSTFSKLTEKIDDMHRNYQKLAIRWNNIAAIADMDQISTEEAYLQVIREEEILKSGTDKEKEELKKINKKRDSWIDDKVKEEYSSDFEEDEDDYFDDEENNILGNLSQAKNIIMLAGLEMMYQHVWKLKPSKVKWKNDGVNYLSMAFLRCNALGEWELFDEAMDLAPTDIINRFKIEFKRNEGIDFDRNISDIKKQSQKNTKSHGKFNDETEDYEKQSDEIKHEYIDKKKNTKIEDQLNLDVALKNVYRKLVRKLHPDHCNIKDANYNWNDLWLQVQMAYKNKDTQKLNEFYYLTGYLYDQFSLSLSEYKTLNTYLEDEVTRLNYESAHMNKHPAWGFSKKKTVASIEKKIKKKLTADFDEITEKVGELDNRFWYLEVSSRNIRKKIVKGKKRNKHIPKHKRQRQNYDYDDQQNTF